MTDESIIASIDDRLTNEEFMDMAAQADLMSYRQIFVQATNSDGEALATYEGVDLFSHNLENLIGIRASLQSPALLKAVEAGTAEAFEKLDIDDLIALKDKIVTSFGEVAWNDGSLTPEGIEFIALTTEQSLKDTYNYVSTNIPSSFIWEYEGDDPEEQIQEINEYVHNRPFNRLTATLAQLLVDHGDEVAEAKITIRSLGDEAEYKQAVNDIAMNGTVRTLDNLSPS